MGYYYFDEENYLHYTGDGWIRTKRPLTTKQKSKWLDGKLSFNDLEWLE